MLKRLRRPHVVFGDAARAAHGRRERHVRNDIQRAVASFDAP
jgi:hypothetical protein